MKRLFPLFAATAVAPPACGNDDSRTPRQVLPAYFPELFEIGRRDNELARRLGLPDCVFPLPGPGGDQPAPA